METGLNKNYTTGMMHEIMFLSHRDVGAHDTEYLLEIASHYYSRDGFSKGLGSPQGPLVTIRSPVLNLTLKWLTALPIITLCMLKIST